jgi:hypothetical protein
MPNVELGTSERKRSRFFGILSMGLYALILLVSIQLIIKAQSTIEEFSSGVSIALGALPLLFLGLHILCPNLFIWKWQKRRIKRHPVLASIILLVGFIGFFKMFLSEILISIPHTDISTGFIQSSKVEFDHENYLHGGIIGTCICLLLFIWFYIGRKKPE